jgi:acyl-CoA reductase-like NAD-dependent aldehyde dehydrogenase
MVQSASIADKQDTIEVKSPSTFEFLGQVNVASTSDVRRAVERGREAFKIWSALGFRERRRVLTDIRRRLLAQTDEVIDVICRETGKPRFEALMPKCLLLRRIEIYGRGAERLVAPSVVLTC